MHVNTIQVEPNFELVRIFGNKFRAMFHLSKDNFCTIFSSIWDNFARK